jgi:hypothetical protein
VVAHLTHRLRHGLLSAVVNGKTYSVPVLPKQDVIHVWTRQQELRPGTHTLWDSCFELPHRPAARAGTTRGAVPTPAVALRIQEGVTPTQGVYDFPGEYAQRFDGIDKGGGTNSNPLPGHPGPILYVGRRDRGVCIHGLATFNRPGCIVVIQSWTELFRALEQVRQVSFVLDV